MCNVSNSILSFKEIRKKLKIINRFQRYLLMGTRITNFLSKIKPQVELYIKIHDEACLTDFLNDVEKLISIGVIPYVTPVRSIPGKENLPITNYEVMLDIYQKVGALMKQYEVNPLKNKAGCVRCGGCSAIKEAFKAT